MKYAVKLRERTVAVYDAYHEALDHILTVLSGWGIKESNGWWHVTRGRASIARCKTREAAEERQRSTLSDLWSGLDIEEVTE